MTDLIRKCDKCRGEGRLHKSCSVCGNFADGWDTHECDDENNPCDACGGGAVAKGIVVTDRILATIISEYTKCRVVSGFASSILGGVKVNIKMSFEKVSTISGDSACLDTAEETEPGT